MILLLDFDGTIVEGFSWDAVRSFYNVDRSLIQKYLEGRIDFKEWTEMDLSRVMKYFKKEDLPDIMKRLPLRKGFKEFSGDYFGRFEDVAIISGGFPPVVREFSRRHNIRAFCPEYEKCGDKFKMTSHIYGETKKRIIEEEYAHLPVVYVFDELEGFEGYELEDYGDNVLNVQMGHPRKRRFAVQDFFELGKLVDRVQSEPGKFWKNV